MIKVIFYKGKGNFYNKLIRVWTGGPYSHCEIVVGDTMYSSANWDDGVRKAKYKKTDNWDEIELDIPQYKIVDFFEREMGKDYDYWGILLSQILTLDIHHPEQWFCSEICTAAIKQYINISYTPQSVHPNKLYKILEQYKKLYKI